MTDERPGAAAAAHPDVPMIWSSGDSAWADGKAYRDDLTNLGNVMGQMEFGKMIAGCAAAHQLALLGGWEVTLVEKLPFLGGNSTAVLDTFYGFYTPGDRSVKVVGGVGDDVISGLREIGSVVERPNTYGAGTGVTYVAEELKIVWERLVVESGASVLLHTFVQDVVVRDGRRGRPGSRQSRLNRQQR